MSVIKIFLLFVLAGILSLGIGGCPADDEETDGGSDGFVDDGGTDAGGDEGGDQGGDELPTGSLELAHAGAAIDNNDTYYVPDNISNPDSSAIALFSEQKDLMVIRNSGAASLNLDSVTITGIGDSPDEEFEVCASNSTPNQCLTYEYGDLAAGATSDFYIHFYALQSGARSATLAIDYTDGDGAKTHTVTIVGHGRVGSDEYPGYFYTDIPMTDHKLWGGYNNNHDEAPGPMAADDSGNVYFAGTASGFIGDVTSADRNIFLVKVNADGSLGWEKQYHSTHHDEIEQTGDNLGLGAADAMVYGADGYLYLTAKAANGANTKNLALVMKVDPADGSAVWIRYWFHDPNRLQYTDSSSGTAIDVVGDRLFVVGDKNIFSMDTAGNLLWSTRIHPQGSTAVASRLHSVRYDGAGNLYLAGLDYSSGASGPFVAKIAGITDAGDGLSLEWAKTLDNGDTEMGSNFDSMDLDADGNVFLAVDRRGAQTRFTLAKIPADGSSFIGKTLPGTAGDRNNIFVVRVSGESLFAGGRTGQAGWDTGNGDGLIAMFNAPNMSLDFAAIYYTGTGPNEVCHHSIHGMAAVSGELHVMGQVYTGNSNYYRYWGYWYEFPQQPEDWAPVAINDVTATTTFEALPDAALVDDSFQNFDNDGVWDDLDSATFNVEFQEATDKNENSNGSATDGDVFIMKFGP